MARLTVLEFPDPRLRRRADPVRQFDEALATLIEDLLETMYASKGIGLAATQVDVHRQVLVMDLSEAKNEPLVFINPEILDASAIGLVEEGCLSVPGIYDNVKRATRIRVRAVDRAGRPYERNLEDMPAVCLQHEMDHLAGKLFVDRLPFFRRLKARRALARARRSAAQGAPPAVTARI